MIVKPSAEGLMASIQAASPKKGPPPVHLWNPPFCGDIDMRIARDGTWFHEGTPIGRIGLVKLFSSILKLEGGKYFLVTPVEKVGIVVEDAPFVAVDFEVTGEGPAQEIRLVTHVGDEVVAGPAHPIRVERDPVTGEPSPYVMIRAGLEALIDRKSFYRLVELGTEAEHDGQGWFGLWSSGMFFPMIPAKDLAPDAPVDRP
ncbi:MAG: hypothetical protein RIT14_2082 [Pseudomonadota bacterium]